MWYLASGKIKLIRQIAAHKHTVSLGPTNDVTNEYYIHTDLHRKYWVK